jgi:transposase-like protein
MRYPASEKLEIIRLVEQSHLPVRRTLEKLGVSRATFYRWCDLSQAGGPEALEDRSPRPDRVWNRIPDNVRGQIVRLALDEPELSPRELATRFTVHNEFARKATPAQSRSMPSDKMAEAERRQELNSNARHGLVARTRLPEMSARRKFCDTDKGVAKLSGIAV